MDNVVLSTFRMLKRCPCVHCVGSVGLNICFCFLLSDRALSYEDGAEKCLPPRAKAQHA